MSALGIIDKQVLKLVDYLIELHQESQTNLDLVSETAFGIKFYPHNRNIITHMRGTDVKGGKGKSAPHLLVFNLGKEFNVDFNFFYDDKIDAKDAFLTKQTSSDVSDNNSINEVFEEIEKRLELFISENKELKGTKAKKYCSDTENELLNIKNHFNKAFAEENFSKKRKEIIEVFDRMIFLSRKKIDVIIANSNLEQNIDKLLQENKQYQADKAKLEDIIHKLNADLAECNKSLLQAKNGETDALKQLLAIKSKN